jgi:UDP-N-acetylmuramoyl-tripeptide--D-alanyl-D-alanine ligase
MNPDVGLWGPEELVTASQGEFDGAIDSAVTGFSIDSRTIEPGEVFVALQDQRDGHEFVGAAFERGAAAALVRSDYRRTAGDKALIRVDDTLDGLRSIARAARARLSAEARVVAVTGSVGKTGTKEMLRACLSRLGATHAPEKSYNNHWGVPLTLARMPASTRYAVLEIGMNHPGEITPLTKLARPHVAIVTTVEPVHLGFFDSVEQIADAKAEIFLGLESFQDGLLEGENGIAGAAWAPYTAVLNHDNLYFERLANRARLIGAEIISFGRRATSDVRLAEAVLSADGSEVDARIGGRLAERAGLAELRYSIAAPGEHVVVNSLAVIAALGALGADLKEAITALADYSTPAGRGVRETLRTAGGTVLLVDESYNANPASMRAALATLALVPRSDYQRRVAVLGDMLELGSRSSELHAGLADAIDAAGVDLVLAAGPHMRSLCDRLDGRVPAMWSETSELLKEPTLRAVRAGDAVMVKGSLGSRMGLIVAALRETLGADGR